MVFIGVLSMFLAENDIVNIKKSTINKGYKRLLVKMG